MAIHGHIMSRMMLKPMTLGPLTGVVVAQAGRRLCPSLCLFCLALRYHHKRVRTRNSCDHLTLACDQESPPEDSLHAGRLPVLQPLMSCVRILRSLDDCQRKHKNQADLICSSLTAAAGWCIFASICPAEVRAIEDCIGISKSIGGAPVIPKRCQDRAALLEACIESQQVVASEKTSRCKGAQPIPKSSAAPAAAT